MDLNFMVKKKVAPRSYCDICEEFDSHETEDCPTQCSEVDLPPRRSKNSKERKLPPPRDFCDNCDGELGKFNGKDFFVKHFLS